MKPMLLVMMEFFFMVGVFIDEHFFIGRKETVLRNSRKGIVDETHG